MTETFSCNLLAAGVVILSVKLVNVEFTALRANPAESNFTTGRSSFAGGSVRVNTASPRRLYGRSRHPNGNIWCESRPPANFGDNSDVESRHVYQPQMRTEPRTRCGDAKVPGRASHPQPKGGIQRRKRSATNGETFSRVSVRPAITTLRGAGGNTSSEARGVSTRPTHIASRTNCLRNGPLGQAGEVQVSRKRGGYSSISQPVADTSGEQMSLGCCKLGSTRFDL